MLTGFGALALLLSGCDSLQLRQQPDPAAPDRIDVPGGQAATALIRSSFGATAKAPGASTWAGAVMLKDRAHALIHGVSPGTGLKDDQSPGPGQAGGPEFEAYLDQQGLPAMTSGSVEIFRAGKTYFPELLREIDAAESQVDIQTYVFDNEDSHVRVRRFLNPWLVGEHSKLHLIDQRIAYVGGMNLGWEYYHDWHDMMVRIEGPVVADLVDIFESRWRSGDWMRNWGLKWGRGAPRVRAPDDRDSSRDIPLRMLVTHTSSGKREILKAASIAIRSASRRVWLQAPYFTSSHIIVELENAVRRGVDVRVVVPGDNESGLMESVNAASLEQFLRAGGKVYAYPGMTHLKAAVFDDWATFGSSNYDTLSLSVNRELNLASSHPKLVEGLVHKIFLPDFRKSRLLTQEELGSISAGPAAEIAGDQL